jgi:hypothetical protein
MAYPPSWFWPDNRAEDASVPIGVEAHSACTAFGAATIDPAETQCDAHALTRREMKSMDKEKEGVLGTISDAAKTSMEATVEGVSSAKTEKAFHSEESCRRAAKDRDRAGQGEAV